MVKLYSTNDVTYMTGIDPQRYTHTKIKTKRGEQEAVFDSSLRRINLA